MKKRILSAILLCSVLLCACSDTSGRSLETETEETTSVQTEAPTTEAASTEAETTEPETTECAMTGLTMTMLDVGEGLSLLIQADGKTMLYDGGGRDSSSYVVSYLEKAGIEKIDCMVVSHYDEDHIAGLIGVINCMPVTVMYCPDYQTDSELYESLFRNAETYSVPVSYVYTGEEFTMGNAQFEVLSSADLHFEEENDNSTVLRMTYGDFSCIMPGDAEQACEEKILESGKNIESDLLVAGHHGSDTSSSFAFLKEIAPSAVWISCQTGNQYGFPTEAVLNNILTVHADLYRSDLQGEVSVSTDGETFSFDQSPCEDYTAGVIPLPTEETESTAESSAAAGSDSGSRSSGGNTENEAEFSYVLNKNSRKFHLPTCKSVDQMKESNKVYSSESREELIEQGYKPCQNCNP